MKSGQPAVKFIFFTLLLDVLGFGLLIPVAPKLVQSLVHPGMGGTESEAARYVGMLTATYAIMQFVFSPILGALSDRYGRRPVLLIALFGSGIDYIAMALAPTLWIFFITRALNGVSGATMTVANAYIADVTPPHKRAAAFGMIGAAFGLGFIAGPVIGGVLGNYNIRYPFYAAALLTMLNWVYGMFVLPESLPPERRNPKFSFRDIHPIAVFASLRRYPTVFGLSASLFLLNVAMFILHATWVLYTSHRYHWTPTQVGLSLGAVGVGAAIVQGFLARSIIPRIGERAALIGGLIIGTLAYVGYAIATQGWMIYVIIGVASIGGLAGPAGQAIITRTVKHTEQGAVQGAITSLTSIANIIGPLLGASVFAYFVSTDPKPPFELPGAHFFLAALLSLIGTIIAIKATRGWRLRDHPAPAREVPGTAPAATPVE